MTRPQDPADRLRRANPLPTEEAEQADSPKARALLQRIIVTPPEATPQRGRLLRRRAWVLVPVALLALAAASYGLFRAVREPLVIACYRRPSLSAGRAAIPAASDAVAACRELWQAGGEFNPDRNPPPPMTACGLDSGAIGVFPSAPGSDVCSRLGLAHPTFDQGEQSEARALIALQGELSGQFLSRCVHRAEAVALANDMLVKSGLRGWRVTVSTPFTAREPCASLAPDVQHRVLILVPVTDSG